MAHQYRPSSSLDIRIHCENTGKVIAAYFLLISISIKILTCLETVNNSTSTQQTTAPAAALCSHKQFMSKSFLIVECLAKQLSFVVLVGDVCSGKKSTAGRNFWIEQLSPLPAYAGGRARFARPPQSEKKFKKTKNGAVWMFGCCRCLVFYVVSITIDQRVFS